MKFINLLKKELSELVNFQMLIGLVATVAIFMILGGVMKTTVDEAVDKSENVTINICDRDNTEFTENIIKALDELDDDPDSNVTAKLNIIECEGDDYSAILEDNDISGLVIIPEGFTETLDKKEDNAVSKFRHLLFTSLLYEEKHRLLDKVKGAHDYVYPELVLFDGDPSEAWNLITENILGYLHVIVDNSQNTDQLEEKFYQK